ncbi:hypothetical protein CEXT_627891 [Caerostris extrusa]|uniref:Uncharacterized protein n=1 Tax=Caerostris extrusa TaxID=172846 RepID=A0AAV4XDH6_CAEEX|nr:hypothetical protein CEXT_627891 [Caerostris extrusa]
MTSVGRLWAISTLFGEFVQRQAIPTTSSSFQPGSPGSPEETPNPIPPPATSTPCPASERSRTSVDRHQVDITRRDQ